MPPPRPLLSVVIPAYNEEARLPATLDAVQDWLEAAPFDWELIVVDDGSKDRTVEVARKQFRGGACRVLEAGRNAGKGAAIRRGMLAARGRYRLFADADNSTPIEEARLLLKRMRKTNADVAVGSRGMSMSRIEVHQPIYREAMGRVFNLIVRALAVPGIRDTQCGFKLFTARAAEAIFPEQRMDGFSFDVEILYLARRKGMRIEEVAIRWINSPASRVSPLRDSWRMFVDVARIRRMHG